MKVNFKALAPIILGGMGLAGLIATAIQSSKDTIKFQETCENFTDETPKKEMFEVAVKSYLPTIGLCTATACCIAGSVYISRKNYSAVLATSGVIANFAKDYRSKVVERHGVEEDEAIVSELAHTYADYHVIGLTTPDAKSIWIEPFTGQRMEAYEREIIDAEYHFNRNYILGGGSTVSSFLTMLGMDITPESEDHGWSICDELYWVDFEHHLVREAKGKEPAIYEIGYVFSPRKLEDGEY